MSFLPKLDENGFIKVKVPKPKKEVVNTPKESKNLRREESLSLCKRCGGNLYWEVRLKVGKKQLKKSYYFTRWERCSKCKSFWMHDEFKVLNVRRQKHQKKKKPLQAKDYSIYITSKKWTKRRRRYFATHGSTCAICGSREGLNLHHKTYKRLGVEEDSDLVPLCGEHHDEFHEMNGTSKNMVLATDTFIAAKRQELEASAILRSF